MTKTKKTPKKRMLAPKAIQQYKDDVSNPQRKDLSIETLPRNQYPTFQQHFSSNSTLHMGHRRYQVLVDTNLINFSIQNKLDLEKAMMDCLYAKWHSTPRITDCVMAELEKLSQQHRVTLRILDSRPYLALTRVHDCIAERATRNKCYIVATCCRDLKRCILKVRLLHMLREYCFFLSHSVHLSSSQHLLAETKIRIWGKIVGIWV